MSDSRLQVLLIGNVIDAVSSFVVSRPKHICILDEVVTSSREYKEGEASGWDDFLENGRSDMWDSMGEQSKASLQYISKKRISLKKINKMKNIRSWNNMHPIEQGRFADIRLEKVMEVDIGNTDISDADMADLGRASPNMQKLNIEHCKYITDVGLIEFSIYCYGLRYINMQHCGNITKSGLIKFSQNCRGLNEICLCCSDGIGGGGVEGLSRYCSDLQIIRIGGYGIDKSLCNDADLLALSLNCQQLQEIHLYHCDEVTGDGLIEMSKHLNSKQFHHIDIWDCELICNRGMIGFSKNCPQLKSIKMFSKNDSFTDECIIEMSKNCSCLEKIDISCNDWVTDISMNAIAKNCHVLKNIDIEGCDNFTEESFITLLESCSCLESINIVCDDFNDWVTGISMNAIAKNCHGLKDIIIGDCPNITEASFKNLIENCARLEIIDISGNKWVTERSINAIAKNCHVLKDININSCRNITEESFINFIESCSGLERIHICGYDCNDWVTDRCIIAITKNCQGLKDINIYECRDIIEESFINLIENCYGLESIDISYNDWVTDVSMNAIAKNCHGLKSIFIDGCDNITKAGVMILIERNPRVEKHISYLL